MRYYYKPLVALCLLALAAVAPATPALAQAKEAMRLSLADAVKYGQTNSVAVRNAVIDTRIAQAKVSETIGIGLPQISGTFDYSHNINVQKVQLETGAGPFGDPNTPPGTWIYFPFQLKNNAIGSITASQLIFSGSYIVGLQASNTYKELSRKNLNATQIDVAENVTKAYYGVLVNTERIKLLDNSLARLDSTVREAQALLKNGFIEQLDLNRLEVSRNNLMVERQKAARLVDLSMALLKFQMGMPADQPLTLTDRLEANAIASIQPLNSRSFDYSRRIEYSTLQTNELLNNLERRNLKASFLPTLGASFTMGWNAAATNVGDLSSRFLNYSFVGARLSWDLFQGFQRTYKLQQNRLNNEKVKNGYEQLRNGIDLQISQSNTNLTNALETLRTQDRNLGLAREVVRVAKIKYSQGLGSNLEVVTAEADLRDAQTNYYAALYDVLIAKTDLDKATGNLLPNGTLQQ